ncbi:MAG: CDP-diacylglycerol--serine O-phosphatidyltransferase [Kiritimatiellae bacterium]|nr:CDP-diacylglycerol--serine O-phosphatidyltransferase [Kiritimatiellia bacterium]
MNWRQVLPMAVTMGAMLAGFFSIIAATAGEYMQAAQFIMLAMILDGVDGTLARLVNGSSPIGAEMDTFVDMVSFGIAPAVLAYAAVLRNFGVWGIVIASAVVLSGVLRLSRFRVIDPHHGQRGYVGLPITVSAGWIALFTFVTESGLVDETWISLRSGPLAVFVWICVLVFTVLQVSHIRYAKPTKDPVAMIPCAVLILLLFLKVQIAVASALTMCAYGFVYAFVSPFFRRRHVLVITEDEEEEEEPVSLRHF